MKVNDREQEFVFRYFQSGKLDTQKALRKVKAGCGSFPIGIVGSGCLYAFAT